jgi:methylated-DNA-[protein]-cysteine S-methyltransferase
VLDSPTGPFFVRILGDKFVETGWIAMLDHAGPSGRDLRSLGPEDPGLLPGLCDRVLAAMAGESVDFEDIGLPPGTDFQRQVWRATRAIPPGRVRTYGEIAAAIGRPAAARAVGQAMRRNPQPIITPCHRVVGSCGLGGFGGHGPAGVWPGIKARLLEAEGTLDRIPTAETAPDGR